ncbi:pyruvate, phosphate dikinase/phosphoenolpyruvate synthase regulator [Gordonia sp. HNM0687]|uniref:Putative phosphoenolpyruvate synthase regulatory protein n=1 Tax=Gordonia mangrovi TaxID=2665643 RepID=A0A6L7GWY0_9ACTN|nr:pyruvate, phosphate dikinase/phosphoenolpyruvate synthase regulator [Gordonia mangrovi]MDY6811733.1 pyruvate, phosphate dikinase/phosphoenolpyruvate synthase regulator [Actinomycetota bacterium]MXP24032.1 pyruvate, phosphate dikinase/phosphoenolpyruvate synthase regulator [Gordonia mangrovi]UVF78163.1 kinase/pyrophosphorylase [Gordonia mangrovi]
MSETYAGDAIPVFFLSDSTGISAETMGNALLLHFPDHRFDRALIPFITTEDDARDVVARIDATMDRGMTPLVFVTAALDDVRLELHKTRAPVIDFFDIHMQQVESILGTRGARTPARLHGVGDVKRYNARMQAVEYAIEHDDGQSVRTLDKADVILVAPSRCGKTPTTMYLALQHGLRVANYPLVDEDLVSTDLPRPIRHLADRCFGILTTAARLSAVRTERRPDSTYASLRQCTYELKRAEELYRTHDLPVIDSSAKSVEEMSTLILQVLARRPHRQD